jgi:hypothetical protein
VEVENEHSYGFGKIIEIPQPRNLAPELRDNRFARLPHPPLRLALTTMTILPHGYKTSEVERILTNAWIESGSSTNSALTL